MRLFIGLNEMSYLWDTVPKTYSPCMKTNKQKVTLFCLLLRDGTNVAPDPLANDSWRHSGAKLHQSSLMINRYQLGIPAKRHKTVSRQLILAPPPPPIMWDDDDDIGEVGGGGGVGVGGAAEERWDVLLETRTREEGAVGEARSRITRRAPRRQKWLQSPQEELRRSGAAAASCVKKQNKKNNINQQRIKSKRWRKKRSSASKPPRSLVEEFVWCGAAVAGGGGGGGGYFSRVSLSAFFGNCAAFQHGAQRLRSRTRCAPSVRPSVRPDLSRWF